jgi:hypothetical protein
MLVHLLVKRPCEQPGQPGSREHDVDAPGFTFRPASYPNFCGMVLYIGAILTVGFTFFFGTKNLPAQVMMTGIVSVIVFMGLLLISFDHPFTYYESIDLVDASQAGRAAAERPFHCVPLRIYLSITALPGCAQTHAMASGEDFSLSPIAKQ